MKKSSSKNLSKAPWSKLTTSQRNVRMLSLKTLDLMREGKSLSKSSFEVGIKTDIAKQHLKSAIYKRRERWRAKKIDFIQRRMNIYERGKIKSITVTNSKDSSLIGEYYNDLKKLLEKGDTSVLRKYKRRVIRDSKGRRHRLETRPQKIFDIEDSKEEPEFYTVYEV